MNRAARLEAANKELGSAICIGSQAAAHIDARLLRPLGDLKLRGVSEAVHAFEPWPTAMTDAAKDHYRAAMALIDTDHTAAVSILQALAVEYPGDRVLKCLCLRAEANGQGSAKVTALSDRSS
jgi:adenylate cyclase